MLSGPLPSKLGAPIDINNAFNGSAGANTGLAVNAAANKFQAQPPQQTAEVAHENLNPAANAAMAGFGHTSAPKWTAEPWKPMGSTAISKVGGGMTGLSGKVNFFPIMSVNPYQNRWTIRGRITNKGTLRKYQNAKGEGVVMSFEIADNSGSIKVACFRDVAERMAELIQMGKTYSISKAVIKQADKRYNRCSSDYEMLLGSESEVELVEDDGSVQSIKYDFVKIADLEKKDPGSFIDVLAIVQDVRAKQIYPQILHSRSVKKPEEAALATLPSFSFSFFSALALPRPPLFLKLFRPSVVFPVFCCGRLPFVVGGCTRVGVGSGGADVEDHGRPTFQAHGHADGPVPKVCQLDAVGRRGEEPGDVCGQSPCAPVQRGEAGRLPGDIPGWDALDVSRAESGHHGSARAEGVVRCRGTRGGCSCGKRWGRWRWTRGGPRAEAARGYGSVARDGACERSQRRKFYDAGDDLDDKERPGPVVHCVPGDEQKGQDRKSVV